MLVAVAVHVVAWLGVATNEARWSTVHISVCWCLCNSPLVCKHGTEVHDGLLANVVSFTEEYITGWAVAHFAFSGAMEGFRSWVRLAVALEVVIFHGSKEWVELSVFVLEHTLNAWELGDVTWTIVFGGLLEVSEFLEGGDINPRIVSILQTKVDLTSAFAIVSVVTALIWLLLRIINSCAQLRN